MAYQFGQPWTPVYQDTALNNMPRPSMFGAPYKFGQPQNSLAPRKQSTTETVHDKIRNALAPIAGNILANKVSGLFDYSPGAAVTTGYDLGQDVGNSNYNSALNNAIATGLNVMPDVGPLAKVGGAVAHSIIAPLWHGSPHSFEKFALEKIGTGEGAQAYGHGLYFAENPEVAKQYQQALAKVDTGVFSGIVKPQHEQTAFSYARTGADPARAARDFSQWTGEKVTPELVDAFGRAKQPGHLYEVKVDANPEDFLNWDKPFNNADDMEQFASRFDAVDPATRRNLENWGYEREQRGLPMPAGDDILRMLGGLGPQSSNALREAGLQGISYLDQGSRAVGNGTRNYVVFDPSIIDILNRH